MSKGLIVAATAGGIVAIIVGVWAAAVLSNAVKFVYGGV